MLLWVNLHGGFAIGFIVLVIGSWESCSNVIARSVLCDEAISSVTGLLRKERSQ